MTWPAFPGDLPGLGEGLPLGLLADKADSKVLTTGSSDPCVWDSAHCGLCGRVPWRLSDWNMVTLNVRWTWWDGFH